MRTSGGGNRDLAMMAVPLAIFVVFGVYMGGGIKAVLHVAEVTLWAAVEWVRAWIA